MSWYEDYQRKLELAKARIENRAFAAKNGNAQNGNIVPAMFVGIGPDRVIEKEIIGSMTGKVIAFIAKDGTHIHAGCDYRDRRTGMSIPSPETEEFEAMQAFNYPHCP